MKEAVVYDMFRYIGAAASLYNYASVSLNGDYRGVYLALEGVEKSFMLRNFGTRDGELYKPDSMGFGGGKEGKHKPENMPDLSKFDPENLPDTDHFDPENLPDINHFDPENIPHDENERKGMRGGFSMGGNGADLNYTDDDPDSYSTIWEGSVSDTGDADHKRVIRALKNIGGGTDLEEYMDIDNVLRYMAVHVFSVNMDSLSGNMAHNYYLYEYDGKLSIIPWDYNLSFGGMTMGKSENAEDMVNDAIDTPFDGTRFFDALLENEQYLARYHEYLRILTEEYVLGGRFEEVYSRIRSQIDELVKTDPTAFYSYDEYEAGAQMLYNTILLRAQSVKGQLEGNIPSTDEEQRNDPSSRIDASEIDIGLMGQFSRGGPAKPAHTEE